MVLIHFGKSQLPNTLNTAISEPTVVQVADDLIAVKSSTVFVFKQIIE